MKKQSISVGDRVRVYGGSIQGNDCEGRSGLVDQIGASGFVFVRFSDDRPNAMARVCVHTKQCRRLKKRERRRVWIAAQFFDAKTIHRANFFYTEPPEKHEGGWIEFIEVKRG